ncbi:acyltransferase family-domain-containing protein [Neocallimastix lanati (nom. inval.)]|nr:acyltransferase family-domain-containing protein [Neocallimastix sp. JGI-2020a]
MIELYYLKFECNLVNGFKKFLNNTFMEKFRNAILFKNVNLNLKIRLKTNLNLKGKSILQFKKTRINDEFVSNIQTISRPQENQKQINISNLNSFVTGSEATLNESLPSLQPKKRKRLYWTDCARIFSMLGIILLHSAGYGCEKTHLKRKDSNVMIICFYNCMTRFAVPMFVLLSGTFILDPSRTFSFKKLFRHNILRPATAFAFWSTINALINIFLYKKNKPSEFLKLFFVGEEYLWFIFMIISCYLISPFLRLFSDDVNLARYFFGLCVFWGSLIPTLKNIFTQDELNTWTSRWHYHFTLEFVGYFVAGYHIVKHVTIKSFKIRVLLYILGLADIFLIFGMTYRLEMKTGRYSKDFRDSYTLTVAFYTVVLFIFFKHEIGRINFSERAIRIISKLSALIFGMYLSHMILKKLLSRYAHIKQEEFLDIKLSSSIGCPTFWMVICGSSLLVSYLLSITPILKNFVV